jgi:outer membrane autotransporter protein
LDARPEARNDRHDAFFNGTYLKLEEDYTFDLLGGARYWKLTTDPDVIGRQTGYTSTSINFSKNGFASDIDIQGAYAGVVFRF